MTVYDITLALSESMVVWPGDPPVRLTQPQHLERGDVCTLTRLELSAHTGTHVDAPAHFLLGGSGIETLDLELLIGPALVVDATNATSISAETLASMPIIPGTERLLIKTRNSARWADGEDSFFTDYVAVEADAARWLVDQGVKLVGVDYLSVAPYDDIVPTHQILLTAGIIPVEGLNLHGIEPGRYQFVCLPLKIQGGDGAPARAILIG